MKKLAAGICTTLLLACGSLFPNSAAQQRELTVLAANGDYDGVLVRLDRGTSADAVNELGDSALMRAAARQHGAIVELLLARGADAGTTGSGGRTALHEAAAAADLEIVKLLLEANARIDPADEGGVTPFAEAVMTGHVPTMRLLMEAGAPLDGLLANDETPLMVALRNDHRQAVAWLIAAGADPERIMPSGETATALAEKLGRLDWFTAAESLPALSAVTQTRPDASFDESPPYPPKSLLPRLIEILELTGQAEPGMDRLANDLADKLAQDRFEPLRKRDGQRNPNRQEPPGNYDWYREASFEGSLYRKRTIQIIDGVSQQTTDWLTVDQAVKAIYRRWKKTRQQLPTTPEAWGLAVRFDRQGRILAIWTAAGLDIKETVAMGDPSAWAPALAKTLNRVRAARGLQPLTIDPGLNTMASRHTADMVTRGFFSSKNPDGLDVRERAKRAGVPVDIQMEDCLLKLSLAELILDVLPPAEQAEIWAEAIVKRQLADPNQARHLLNPAYSKAGIGLTAKANGRLLMAQNFFFQPDLDLSFTTVAERFPPDLNLAKLEVFIHLAVNQARIEQGLKPLTLEDPLARLARSHSRDMATHRYFDHRNRNGEFAADRAERMRVRRKVDGVAENLYKERILETLAIGFGRDGTTTYIPTYRSPEDIAKRVVDGWMNSPGHRANLLTPELRFEGIGLALDNRLELYVTQNMY